MSDPITNTDIADLHEALGNPDKAELYRYLDEPDPDLITLPELADELYELLTKVQDSTASAKHNEDCWQKHAACLAERIEGLLP